MGFREAYQGSFLSQNCWDDFNATGGEQEEIYMVDKCENQME